MPRPWLPLLPLVLAGALAAAEGEVRVSAVAIEGLRQIHPDRVRFMLQVREGRAYAQEGLAERMADDLRALERMGPFAGVRTVVTPVDGGVRVTYRVEELPYVAEIAWEGLRLFQQSDLEKAVQTRRGAYLNPVTVESDRAAVQRTLVEQGWRHAVVAVRDEPVGAHRRLVFAVELGHRVEVGRVVFAELPPGVRPWMFDTVLFNRRGGPWQADLLGQDRDAVVRVLQEQGYLDARLTETLVEWNDYVHPIDDRRRAGPELVPDGGRDDRVVIIYRIEPGARYRLGQVSFVGSRVAGQAELREAFARRDLFGDWVMLDEGEPFVKPVMDAALERSRRIVSNQGYARAAARVDRRFRKGEAVVDLTVVIDDGRPYRVGRVDVEGNTVTRDQVARRALVLGPGDRWSDDRLEESERQLRRIGLFTAPDGRPLRVERRFPEDRPDEVDLVTRLRETDTGSFSFQLGYSTASGVFGQLSYTERNFDLFGVLTEGLSAWRGGGQTLEFSTYLSQDRQSYNVTHSNPSLLDGPFTSTVSGFRSLSSVRDWDERRQGGSAVLGRRFLDNDLRLTLGYRYTDLKIDDIDDDAPDDALASATTGLKAYQNTVILGQEWDRLNDRRLPTRGVFAALGQEFTGQPLSASETFFEWNARVEGYIPFFESEDGGVTFLRTAARWRQIVPFGGSDEIPFYERITGGGPGPRHRGFENNELGPKEINANGLEADVGGDRDLVMTAEWWVPLQGTNDGLRGILFTDVGNVWGTDEQIGWKDLRVAAGAGIRLPIALPIALDVAWLLDRQEGESPVQVHFGIGLTRF
jgi:outer membrane protein insertion porin family